MKLEDFIAAERRQLALFEAFWRANMARGEMADGQPTWPNDMPPGHWDEQLHFFDPADATRMGFSVQDGPDGMPMVIEIPQETEEPEPEMPTP